MSGLDIMDTTPPNGSLWGPADDSSSIDDNGNIKEEDDDEDGANDAEGVWSQDIEQSFQEALTIYPPCGRRKIILSDEGKMYGRNELIARYIKLRTGKTRTRKQVSSHIQVLARRKSKEIQAHIKIHEDGSIREKTLQTLHSMSSAQIVSAAAFPKGHHPGVVPGGAPPPHLIPPPGAPHHPAFPYGSQAALAALSSPVHHPAAAYQGGGGVPNGPPHPSQFWQSGLSLSQATDPLKSPYVSYAGLDPSTTAALAVAAAGGAKHHPPHDAAAAFSWPPSAAAAVAAAAASGRDSADDNSGGPAASSAPENRYIAGPKLRLVEFSAYVATKDTDQQHTQFNKHLFVHIGSGDSSSSSHSGGGGGAMESIEISQIADKFPKYPEKNGLREMYEKGPQSAFYVVKFWADINTPKLDSPGAIYAVDSQYECLEEIPITCSTKLCSFGSQVVEKVEHHNTHMGTTANGNYIYRINRSEMCDYLINFIGKLKSLPERFLMNNVLENFTILQVITHRQTDEVLLCIAFIFEVTDSDHGPQHHTYRLSNTISPSSNSSGGGEERPDLNTSSRPPSSSLHPQPSSTTSSVNDIVRPNGATSSSTSSSVASALKNERLLAISTNSGPTPITNGIDGTNTATATATTHW